jgi:glycosyltransferase involved in cell wall biosynthesis
MSLRVCFVYQWATYGGVERVFLNRVLAFKDTGEDVLVDVHYGSDGGGMNAFVDAIAALDLQDRMRVVDRLDPHLYDIVFIIDSPGMFPAKTSGKTRWVVECHTAYTENRGYLDRLPTYICKIVVPSHTFLDLLLKERPALQGKVDLLRNCVLPSSEHCLLGMPAWSRRPILYFGRLDSFKNPQGFLKVLHEADLRQPETYFGVVVGPESSGGTFDAEIDSVGLHGSVIRLPPLKFSRVGLFLRSMREMGGVMVSPSRGESFGLAAAESVVAGMPVLLSNLPAHAELVGGDDRYLYDPDDPVGGAVKLERITGEYDQRSEFMLDRASSYSSKAFGADWAALLLHLGLYGSANTKF